MISVYTEMSEADRRPSAGWILFDGNCQFCRSCVRRLKPIFEPRGFAFLPLQTPWVRAFFRMPEDRLLSEMRVLLRSGETNGGADAVIALAKHVLWAWPLVIAAYIPGVLRLLRALYRYIATRRSCLSGACSINTHSPVLPPTDHKGASL
jgi:predicted DCC family thiol-disulfide oxidoreductase YuxK